MKNSLYKLIATLLFCMAFTTAQAQIFPALTVFDADTGTLKMPSLLFQGKLYYLEMTIADAGALTLQIDEESMTDITPDGSLAGNVPENIVGTWTVDGEDTQFTFNGDASWNMEQAAGVDEGECPDGGAETGTFRYTASTGVFIPTFISDDNGQCGLSHSGGVLRFYPDGNTLTVRFGAEDETATLTRVD